MTDGGIRGVDGYYKNIDDILTASDSVAQMEKRPRHLLDICRTKNIKLNPQKFSIGHIVQFGAVDLKGVKAKGDMERRVYIAPASRRLEEFLEIETPKNKKDVMRIIGLANQLKKWVPEMAFSTVHLRRLSSVNVRFVWTPDLESELKKLKETIKNCVGSQDQKIQRMERPSSHVIQLHSQKHSRDTARLSVRPLRCSGQ
jgi:hypothetical protein